MKPSPLAVVDLSALPSGIRKEENELLGALVATRPERFFFWLGPPKVDTSARIVET